MDRRTTRRLLTVIAVVIAAVAAGGPGLRALLGTSSPELDGEMTPALVIKVVDGDTVHARVGSSVEKVRLIGIDAPEDTKERELFGDSSTAYARESLLGRTVWLETDVELRDRYGRLLAYIWLEPPANARRDARSALFNALMVRDGFAQVYTFPPNVAYAELLVELQREARTAQRGLWAIEGAADPLTGRRAEQVP